MINKIQTFNLKIIKSFKCHYLRSEILKDILGYSFDLHSLGFSKQFHYNKEKKHKVLFLTFKSLLISYYLDFMSIWVIVLNLFAHVGQKFPPGRTYT